MPHGLVGRQGLHPSRGFHRSGCDADCLQPVLAESGSGHSTSVGPAHVQALKEEPAGSACILSRPDRLELASKLQQEPCELRPPAQLEPLERAAAFLPERAEPARARLDLAEAFLHAAHTCFHAASLTKEPPSAIGTVADVNQ